MNRNIFVLTGAGVSAESGLGTFRDKTGEGIWARFDPMTLATPEGFESDPEAVLAFYDQRRRDMRGAKPNAAHFALARLAVALAKRGGPIGAGDAEHRRPARARRLSRRPPYARRIVEGALRALRGLSEWLEDLEVADVCPRCGRAGGMRPHVVWFGELPLYLDEIDEALRRSDLFVAIGTSGAVYPAAGFVLEARAMGVETCEINLESADNAALFDDCRYGPASETVPAWVEDILGR